MVWACSLTLLRVAETSEDTPYSGLVPKSSLLRAGSSWVLSISKVRDSTTCPGNHQLAETAEEKIVAGNVTLLLGRMYLY